MILLWMGLGGSPIALALDLLVEDFEDISDCVGVTLDSTTVFAGNGSGQWEDQVNTTSFRKSFSPNLDASDTAFLAMMVHSDVANGAEVTWVVGSDNDADPEGWDYYRTEIVLDWEGWRYLKLSLEDWVVARSPLGWQDIDEVRVSASGWSNTPLADSLLHIDDLRFGHGLIDRHLRENTWTGGDFEVHHRLVLSQAGAAGTALTFEVLGDPELVARTEVPAGVTLDGNGEATVDVVVRLDAADQAALEPLATWRGQLLVRDGTGVRDGVDIDAGVPLAERSSPRLWLETSDLDRIRDLAAAEGWANNVLQGRIDKVQGWPGNHEAEFGLSAWSLPPEGGQWSQWYICPDHDKALSYQNGAHICPEDGAAWTGWPYDQVIYARRLHDLREIAVASGLGFQIQGDEALAAPGREILVALADAYSSYTYHDKNDGLASNGGRMLAQTLDEAVYFMDIAWAYDLLSTSTGWQGDEKERVENDLLRAGIHTIQRHDAGIGNWQSWHNGAIAAVGFVLEDPTLIQAAIQGGSGFLFQMAEGTGVDGFWHEGSWAYHYYALDPLMLTAEAGHRAGLSLWEEEALRNMFTMPIGFMMPDGGLPAFNDSKAMGVQSRASLYELAWQRLGDDSLALPIHMGSRALDGLVFGVGELPVLDDVVLGPVLFEDSGYAILRGFAANGSESYAALDFGPHGGWHGHFDKLGFVSYGQGRVHGLDPGTQSYAASSHNTWDKVTLAHNTVVIDETSQLESAGSLHTFAGGRGLSLARAQSVEAYEDVELDRLLIQAGDYLLDRFAVKATDGSTRTIDWAYHNPGHLSSDHALLADSSLPSSEGYQHLSSVASVGEDGALGLHWSTGLTTGTAVGSIWGNDSNTATSFTLLDDANQAQEGSWTGQIEADFTGSASNAYSLFSLDPPEDLPEETVEGLYFWLYGDGSGVNLAARVLDDTDERFVTDIGPIDWVGWREFLVSDPETWSHFQGNDDGLFDLPLSKISFQVENGGTGTSTLLLDGISLELASGSVSYENFEQEASGLDLVVLGEAGTTLFTANGLGASLEDVPMALVRRSATETVYESVMAPFTGASIVEDLRRLESDFGFAWEVDGVGWVDIVVVAERAGIGIAGEMQTDGLAARLRTDDATLAPLRADIVSGSVLAHNDALVLGSMGAVDNLSVTWSDQDLLVECASGLETELRIYGPETNDVVVGKDSVVFRQDGDYVVLSWPAEVAVDTAEPGDTSEPEDTGEAEATDTGSTDGAKSSGGCGCTTGSRTGSGGWLLGGLLVVGLMRRRRGENQQTA